MARQLRVVESSVRLASAVRAHLSGGGAGPIGFEFGREHVRLLQLERRGGDIALRAATSFSAPEGEGPERAAALRELVAGALRSQPFRGRSVVTVLPDPGAKLMVLNYELGAGADEAQHILGLVQERVEEPLADCVVDYLPIRSGSEREGPCSSLVAVARQSDVIDYLDLLRAAGLEVEALEIAPVAVHRLVGWLAQEDHSRHTLVLHCGQQRTHLIGMAGRRLVLYREVEFGEAPLVETLAKALDLAAQESAALLEQYGVWPDESGATPRHDVAEAVEIAETVREILKPAVYSLAEQVERASVYTASQWRGASLERICLLGAFARWPGVDRLIESLVEIPTQILHAEAALTDGRTPAAAGLGSSLAMGMAMRGMQRDE